MYCTVNYKTKKALRDAITRGERVTIFAPGLGTPVHDGIEYLEGPHYPEAHRWYAQVEMINGEVVRIIR